MKFTLIVIAKKLKTTVLKNKYNFINRKKSLKKDSANGNHLLNYHSKIISR